MQSRLPVGELGRIWELSDLRKQGSLSLPEFALAMFLAQSRIRGKVLPDVLPPAILAEIQAANALPPAVAAPQAMLTPQMALAPQQRAMSTQMSMAPPPPASMPAMRAGTSPPAGADLDDS
ncbi:actin organization and endocytosis protein, partial [Coemansia nantahalensis]